eukprot:7559947-Pyramimonas_sp.AAC.1
MEQLPLRFRLKVSLANRKFAANQSIMHLPLTSMPHDSHHLKSLTSVPHDSHHLKSLTSMQHEQHQLRWVVRVLLLLALEGKQGEQNGSTRSKRREYVTEGTTIEGRRN